MQDASVLFVELSRFHELAPASEPEAVISLLNDVFCDVRADNGKRGQCVPTVFSYCEERLGLYQILMCYVECLARNFNWLNLCSISF